MKQLPVTIAFWDYDRTLPIADGRVSVEGCVPTCFILPPEETFARAFGAQEFDIAELSLSRYAQSVASGASQYTGIPVFLSRAFRHASLYVRRDLPIRQPRDLVGRRIGLNNYDDTAAVVIRGFLRDLYGLNRDDIHWVVGDIDVARANRPTLKLYADVPLETLPLGRTLAAELSAGRLDGLIALAAPASYPSLVQRLFDDFRKTEQAYFRRTRLFPIMHLVGIRSSLLDAHPWLLESVTSAFEMAKSLAVNNLANLQACKATLPWIAMETLETQSLMGSNYWPYGFEANEPVLEMTLRHLWEDGLLARPLNPRDLFGKNAVGCRSIS